MCAICAYIYVHMCAHMHTYIHKYTYIYIYILYPCAHTCIYVCMWACQPKAQEQANGVHIDIYIYIYMHTNICTNIYVFMKTCTNKAHTHPGLPPKKAQNPETVYISLPEHESSVPAPHQGTIVCPQRNSYANICTRSDRARLGVPRTPCCPQTCSCPQYRCSPLSVDAVLYLRRRGVTRARHTDSY